MIVPWTCPANIMAQKENTDWCREAIEGSSAAAAAAAAAEAAAAAAAAAASSS